MVSLVGIVGSGMVGTALSDGFLKHGYAVIRGSRTPAKLEDWRKEAGDKASTGTFEEVAKTADLLVLCVGGSHAVSCLELMGLDNLTGKTIIDATNPLYEPNRIDDGVVEFFTKTNESLMEILQAKAPKANFVKGFSCVGSGLMVDPDFGEGGKPTMFSCGNSDEAKTQVKKIMEEFGWEFMDFGGVKSARAIEPLCQLWCLPGFKNNMWGHAFKVLQPPK